MKKLLGIVVLGLLLSSNSNASVFYCIDDIVTGMEGNYKTSKNYKSERFNIKFDVINKKATIDGIEYKQIGQSGLSIFVNDFGGTIRFFKSDGNKIGYHRSYIFGMSDAIFVANGECEKF